MEGENRENELLLLLAVTQVKGIGLRLIRRFVESGGEWSAISSSASLSSIPLLGPKLEREKKNLGHYLQLAEKEIRQAEEKGIHIVPYWSPSYPKRLWQIEDPPPVLFVKGDVTILKKVTVAIVGTRKPSPYGLHQTRVFAQALTKHAVHILSGLAYGIDQVAHKAVLESGGVTSAVLGHGLGYLYPYSHRHMAEQILNQGGCLITEYWYHTSPEAHHFPVRNRLIAGLSHALLIPESYAKGGALITARYAYFLGRPVFALPGPITSPSSEGTHFLIKNQIARLCTSPEDIFEALPPLQQSTSLPLKEPLTPMEAKLIAHLETHGTLSLDELVSLTSESPGSLLAHLMTLECKGYIVSLPGQRFQLSVFV
jgi:DNA processing protein